MRLKSKFSRVIFIFAVLFIMLGSLVRPNTSLAVSDAMSIIVGDPYHTVTTWTQMGKDVANWAKDMAYQQYEWVRDQGIALAYKKALRYFLETLAYDTATYLATGDKGQGAMFHTESWGDYLSNVADNAAGHFLEELGEGGPVRFNLCDPGLPVTMQIGLGLKETKRPDEPDCTYTEMKNNWEEELDRPDFLNRFVNIYQVESNDFGIALSLHNRSIESEMLDVQLATINRQTNEGFKDVTDKISGAIKTPASTLRDYVKDTIEKSGESYFTYTGSILADAIDVFTNTLISKLAEEWLKKGLSRSHDDTSYTGDWGGFSGSGGGGGGGSYSGSGGGGGGGSNYSGGGGLTDYEASGSGGGGIAQAKKQFEALIAPSFAVKGDYEALNDLISCGNPVDADTTDCVITDNFRQAVDKRLSLGEAVEQGFINKNGTFGFKTDGLEPSYTEGLPYRSMIILRKYRIIPVGWELAAQYIMENQNTLRGSFNLSDMIACFDTSNGPDDRYPGYSEAWCEGLVDPAWVLKAPQNFCKREGPGPHIISQQVTGSKDDSKLVVNRDTNYCGDEQTCVKENDDGSCEVYGYCVEDRRKYNFNGESCDPKYNTCQSFRAKDGRTISLLENTLNYNSCDSGNAGCEHYMQAVEAPLSGATLYNNDTQKVDWANAGADINLDDTAAACEEGSEGCHEFIRTKPGVGANLLTNPGFEGEYYLSGWGDNLGIKTSDPKEGFSAVQLTNNIERNVVIDPSFGGPFDLAGSIFTLSFYVRNCEAGSEIRLNDSVASMQATDWRLVAVTKQFASSSGNILEIRSTGANDCVVDAFKLERTTPEVNGTPTQYVPYRGVGVVYQKLIPDYLYNSCYEAPDTDGFIRRASTSPAICDDFARPCTASEVNCEMYDSVSDNFNVPAVVGAEDYCPAKCVGYDGYMQSETNFEPLTQKYLIPSTAKECNLLAKGCDEFTNLDEQSDPEAREYYVHLRQCIEPDDSEATCQPFFMWEGSDESGYQLKVHQLNAPGGVIETVTPATCSVVPGDLNYDADCREFYDAAGGAHYEIFYNTISCTEDCHPYRRSMDDDTQENCESRNGTWADGFCTYKGVPSEGITCSAEEAGCREYNGNAGANTRIIFENTFENGTNQSWVGGTNSNTSVIAGQHSLAITNAAELILGSNLVQNRSYVLQFLASGNNLTSISFVKTDSSGTEVRSDFDLTGLNLGSTWRSYEVNLNSLDHTIDPANEKLLINGTLNIDNIRLTEVVDRYYLIKNSWTTDCDHLNADMYAPLDIGRYAGCDAYTDMDSVTHNLYQFNHLCPDEAVGCELMIDTHNSTDYASATHFDTNNNGTCDPAETDCRIVPADSYAFVVYDKEKTCAAQDKGCERLGLDYVYDYPGADPYHQYFDNYKRNDPDKYSESLCADDAVRCDSFESRDGTSYFKDPNDMICEWRIDSDKGLGRFNWFKKKVSRCDSGVGATARAIDASVYPGGYLPIPEERSLCTDSSQCATTGITMCESDEDCTNSVCVNNECHYECVLDENDYLCELDNTTAISPKTAGLGGLGSKISQPLGALESRMWAGACPGAQDDCTEFVDPVSRFSPTIDILEPYTLYILNEGTTPACPGAVFYKLDKTSNRLVNSPILVGDVFYYASATECKFNPDSTKIRKAVVGYQLEYSLDKGKCNGMVDLDSGCQLFNERSIDGSSGYINLGYDANLPYNVPAPPVTLTAPALGDSNMLLKVSPDRECNKWLSCRSFIKDNEGKDVCFDVGLCERFDDNGNCSYFAPSVDGENQVYPDEVTKEDVSSMTGYSKVSYGAYGGKLMADYYPVSDMRQVGQVAIVGNGSFEKYDKNLYPIGWTSGEEMDWKPDHFKVINNPVAAQTENIKYPVDGSSFLKYGAKSSVESEAIELVLGQSYTLTFYMNTKNLARGAARIDINGRVFGMAASLDWKKFVETFTATANSATIKFSTLKDASDGNIFVDDVSIKPALNSRDNWRTPQDCRLYPENDSLSCDYFDDSGKRKVGWPGYCLEYDRYPGNPDACLLWYPIDRINGDGFEEGGGYIDREPLYYCVGTNLFDYHNNGWYRQPTPKPLPEEVFASENNFGVQESGDVDITVRTVGDSHDYEKDNEEWTLEQLGLGKVEEKWLKWENISHIRIHMTAPSVYCREYLSDGWGKYFRFYGDAAHEGELCPNHEIGFNDCIPYTVPHHGGVSDTDEWFWEDEEDIEGKRENATMKVKTVDGKFAGLYTSSWDVGCNHPDWQILEVVIFPKVYYCSDIIQTVTPSGQNKYYSDHVYEGSDYELDCNDGILTADNGTDDPFTCVYSSDLAPFGAVAQPGMETNDWAVMSNPYMWDSKEKTDGNQPLFYEVPNGSMFNDSQARMGQGYSEGAILGGLFAQYYARWTFEADTGSELTQVVGHYEKTSGGAHFNGGGSAPSVFNVSVSPSPPSVNSMVKLTFNTNVAPSQLPMTMMTVNWGDGTFTSISGMEMRDRPEANNPHTMYHIYGTAGNKGINISIRDNWGVSGSGGANVNVQSNY